MWEQITLHDLIIQHDLQKPAFKKWLRSTNDTVVMFALRMIREFKQGESEMDVRKTLLHPSPKVKQLAVQVAGDMAMKSTLDLMKRMYKKEDYPVCLEIVRSMGKMPDMSMMGFLKLVLDKEEDVQLQIEASKAIENMGQEGIDTLNKLMSSEYKNYSIIIKHVLDRRIF
jgi:HEAT repeat protein